MNNKFISWAIFCILSIVWGSSFILIKEGLTALSAYQVASLRMLFSGLVLLPFAISSFKKIPKEKMGIVFLSGFLGNFIPSYLFCIAETNIDSSLAGILNSLTPLFTILVGLSFFNTPINKQKILGVIIGFIGLCLLFAAGKNISFQNLSFASLVLVATFFYGLNVNVVGKYLNNMRAIDIASVAFAFLIIPSAFILYMTGYFSMSFNNPGVQQATMASIALGVVGTAIASILFYVLVKRAGIIFASTVTYAIPFISLAIGLYYNEPIHPLRLVGLGIILCGVYIVNKQKK